ncbi:3-oxoacyl-ACP reductase FabG [Sulfidibacter corallicola]|uniref:3-oxoacyl-ACP reductase FabG n=1 Tax=Sulfidibacter corallicola TaxID=2818388 RepID=A0A8A4TLQ0_SULCO|nr:3-oxoacyl-ACP reductase FabG [Sulfidibacter corallicola]QTD50032.1 3-oxoacyl-ACP reductase FabG [Sulfidibacter corallicola]
MNGLENKITMITGAGSGIGRATALRFAQEGARLCLVDRVAVDALEGEFPNGTQFLQADVSTQAGIDTCASFMDEHGIDVLINNAGITRDKSIGKMSREDWDQVIAVNLTAVFELCRAAAQRMREQQSGVILNAASVVAHFGNFGQANYAATKAGVIGLTKTLAKELGRFNVRVNAVAPGFIETPMTAAIPEKVLDQIRSKPPLARMGRSEEIASAYAFLASDDASYITGTTLNVDGGLVLG